jgi:tetratricopeptide (TPR) repeat protein
MTLTAVLAAFCLAAKIVGTPAEEPWLDRVLSAEPAAVLKAAASRAAPEKADVEILLHEGRYEFDAQGRTHRTTRLIFRVLGESAVSDWSVVRATWSPWHQERPVIKARVISADGKAHLLDAATLSEAPASEREADLFSDRRQLHAPLPAVAVGAVVEEQITIRESQPFFAAGVLERFDFWSHVRTRRIRLKIDAPADAPLHYQALAIKLEPKRTVSNGRVMLLFETTKVAAPPEIEPLVPSSTPRLPHVAFANGRSWAEVAQGYSQLAQPRLRSDKLQQLAAEIVGNEKSRTKVAGKLLAHVQSLVRYTGLEFGAAAIVPHSPDDTLARRYGDCKDQAALLVGLLRAAGLPAHIALLHSRGLEDISTDLPALSVFNHAIVYMPGNPPLWIDPTARNLRCGTLPLADQGKLSLVIAPETKALTRIPQASAAENYLLDTREFRLSEAGKTRVIRVMEAGGSIEHSMRCDYAQLRPSEIRQRWADYIEQAYRTKHITHFACTEPKNVDQPFRLRSEATDSDLGLVNDTEATVILSPSTVLDRLPYFLLKPDETKSTGDDTAKRATPGRKAPLVLNAPYRYELTYRVTPPVGYLADRSAPDKTLRFGPASLSWSFETEADETVVASIKFDAGDGHFQPADVDHFRSAISELREHRGTEEWHFTLRFEHRAQKLIAARKFREGLAEYRKLLTQHGDNAELEDRFADALVSAGFGTAAQLHARRAVQLAPRSSECWHTLGRMLTYDEMGRHFRGNFDWPGAAAAYRQALQYDPHNLTARWNNAILHEYDELGRRFGHQAKLSAALDQFRKVRAESPNIEALNDSFLVTLLYAGRFAEIKEVTAGMKQSSTVDSMRLAATAVEDGLKQCLALADKTIESADDCRARIIDAAGYLEESRQYALSVQLLQQARVDEPLASRFRALSKTLLQLRRYEEVLLPPSDPCHVVQRLYLAVLLGGNPQSEIAALLPAGSSDEPHSGLEGLQAYLHAVLQHFEQRHVPADRRGDAVSLVTFESAGTDETGYRIRAKYGNAGPITWYVQRSPQGYRLWDVGAALGGLGAAAMRQLERGNVDAARQQLQWAAQELNEPIFMLDPYGGTPFGRLWLGIDKSKADQLRLPAALLMTNRRGCQSAIEFLTKVRDQQDSKYRKLQIDRALAVGLAQRNRLEEVIKVADRMLEAYPQATEPNAKKASAWVRLGKPEEARKLGEERLKQLSSDVWARRLLGDLACERNDYPAVEKYLRHGIKADPGGYFANTIAWNAVYCTPVPAIALADAQRAVEIYPSAAALHTLATVYAELGKTDEARINLKLCIDSRGFVENIDWYVQGRIAEQDGCPDVAREAYRKVVEPTGRWLTTTYLLAQRRLKILGR